MTGVHAPVSRPRPAAEFKVTRGLPGSGKTTRALTWVAEDPQHRARVNRDARRAEMHGGWLGKPWQEEAVTTATTATIVALITTGISVVVDDTNLDPQHLDRLLELAQRCGASAEVWDMTDVPLETCIARDSIRAARGDRYVGEDVIRRLHARWVAGRPARRATDVDGWIGSRTVPTSSALGQAEYVQRLSAVANRIPLDVLVDLRAAHDDHGWNCHAASEGLPCCVEQMSADAVGHPGIV